MQGLFRNPLADPGIIGVSGGAALGAALAIVLLAPLGQQLQATIGVGLLPLLAFLGGALTTTLVYLLGTREGAPRSPSCCWPGSPSLRSPAR